MGINVLSLFDGISCGMVALERTGIKVDNYYASEIDKHAEEISDNNYNKIIRLGDITKINKTTLRKLPKIDLILVGTPCQGFSRNGNMLNFDHEQSKLFFNFIEILSTIRLHNNLDVKFILENVEMKKEWKDTITKYVSVEPLDINSNLLSAQNRPRTYWTNIEGVEIPEDNNICLKDILIDFNKDNLMCHQGLLVDKTFNEKELNLINVVNGEVRISQATKQGYIVANDGDGVNLSFPTSKTRRGRVIKQKSNTLDKQCNVSVYYDNILRKLTIEELEKLQTLPAGYTDLASTTNRKKAIGNGWTVDVISHILKYL
ncbi:MAG: DNA cytosine methyltransferase [Clostridium sp.]|uniref:DNA cytosine methyltransferase n=1 Tax=Clostridium sp. TaxID=1506 RepID=UPI003EE4BBAA